MRSRLECRCRLSPRLSRSMTATGRRGCRRICCRRSATSLARIRTSASTSRGASSSIRTGLGAVDGSLRQLITLNFFCVIEGRAGSAMLLALFVVIERALASDQHMAIAWVLAKEGGHCLPDRVAQGLSDSGGRGALEVRLSAEEVVRLEAAVPAEKIAGSRYDKDQMAMLDSEK